MTDETRGEEETWGDSVRRRRHELGLSQSALADLAGVSRGTLRNIESALVRRVNRLIREAIEGALSARFRSTPVPVGQGDARLMLGYAYSPAAHNAVRQLAVSAEIVLLGAAALMRTDPVEATDLTELLHALSALPAEVRGGDLPENLRAILEAHRD